MELNIKKLRTELPLLKEVTLYEPDSDSTCPSPRPTHQVLLGNSDRDHCKARCPVVAAQ